MDAKHFSFSELEKKIAAMPEGPVAALNRPRWQYWLDVGGGVGVIVGLLPSLLVQFLEIKSWMITMTNAGFWMTLILFAPGFLRNIFVLRCRSGAEDRKTTHRRTTIFPISIDCKRGWRNFRGRRLSNIIALFRRCRHVCSQNFR